MFLFARVMKKNRNQDDIVLDLGEKKREENNNETTLDFVDDNKRTALVEHGCVS